MCHDVCTHPIQGGDHLDDYRVAIDQDGSQLPALLVLPEIVPAPAVLVIHDIHGANAFYEDVTRRLAAAGFAALLPDFFFRLRPPADDSREAVRSRASEMTQATALTDIQTALIWLKQHQATNGSLGTVGFCLGGTLVMLAAARTPRPDASVAFYGFPHRERTPNAPILPRDSGEVVNMDSPLLGLWGDQDQAVGMENVAAYDNELSHSHKPHEFVIYPERAHGFLTFDPSSPDYEDSSDAWERTLTFLRTHTAKTATTS